METIKRKNGNTYREKIYINGKAITKCFSRKGDASKWKREKIAERDRHEIWGISLRPDTTYSQYVTGWLVNKSNSGLATRSIESYKSIIDTHLIPFWGNYKLTKVHQSDANNFLGVLAMKKLKVTRINNIITILKMTFDDAVNDNYLLKNPLSKLSKLKASQREKSYWNLHEIQTFLRANKGHEDFQLYQVALNTGMRRGELLGLCWDAIDFSRREINVKRQLDRHGLNDTTKSKRSRLIKMNESTYSALLDIKRENRNDTFVFSRRSGELHNISHFGSRHFKAAIKRAGVKIIRFHDLRTTFACNWCTNGGNLFALSKILGHSSIKITQQSYADLHPEFMEKVAGTVEFSIDSTEIAHSHLSLA